ncbi:hypothetical protein [Mucilaginibacter sp. BT774]|uniref:hypothetical protein n=1 Tax=Mucilaginibacter sp. BT774 TaxID=3062276 RepID=UPI002675A8BF|nr:hypothetical protein [Mucilaginibacter sp. BT774]MDO3628108.1 hypothetical protein [Mucilaginibacter sp. BT774]
MKNLKLSLIVLLMLGAFSCKKDNSASSSSTITTDQAADIAASSLAENSNGFATVTDDVAVNAQGISSVNTGLTVNSTQATASVHQECGTTLTDSVTRNITADSVTINYFFKYSHTLNCNSSNVPDNLINALTYKGSFDGPRLTSTNTGSANVTIAGLSPTATNFVLNGEYKRDGSFQSKVGNKASGNSHIDIVGTNIMLSKPGRKILSGSATISINGTGPKGNSFSYTGTIVFNGDNTATLTITGGASYTINLLTGWRARR